MGISYDPPSKKWTINYEKTDYDTSLPTNFTTNAPTDLATNYPTNTTRSEFKSRLVNKPVQTLKTEFVNGQTVMNWVTEYQMTWENYWDTVDDWAQNSINAGLNQKNAALNAQNAKANQINAATNATNTKTNETSLKTNTENTAKNAAYDKTYQAATTAKGGDYTTQRALIRSITDINDTLKSTLENNFKAAYSNEKLQSWDGEKLGAKPAYGTFDPTYYKNQNPAAKAQWDSAVANDDIDITQRYGETGFYLQHYTNQGKPAGARGNATEATSAASSYVEKKPTDAELQQARSLQLGIDDTSQVDRLLNVPEIADAWSAAKEGDTYWKNLAKEHYLDVNKKDDFAALFRLSERPEDKQVSFTYNANANYGITELEDALNQAVGTQAEVDVKRFGALTQNVLKDTIAEITKAKQKEQTLSLLSGFGGLGEIMDINQTLSDSLLGDSGVGGVLSFIGGGNAEKSLLKGLEKVTGIQNNVTYNWQQWFDTSLKEKYSKAQEVDFSSGDTTEKINIDADFARNFIEKYLQPRFDGSKSMNEFVEYLDVRQEEQNPFQTQDLVNATKLIADLRSKQYLDQVSKTPDQYFNSDFYFNPTGNTGKADTYTKQTDTVAADWEAAKGGDPYWAQQAYRFGIDLNNKEQFARMHFQVKGQGLGYDPAEDTLSPSKITNEIYSNILPALKAEALKQGTIFGQFITPDEFADQALEGIDLTNKASWDEVLKKFGLDGFNGTVDDLKTYIKETLQSGTATEIRAQIKKLNEKNKTPTQKELGLTYIERPTDFTNQAIKPETELYKTFQSAGFKGTEDEFYTKFFPDLDRSEQTLLTKAGSNDALSMTKFNFNDPFASLGKIESFFTDDSEESSSSKTNEDDSTSVDSYFKLGLADEEDGYQKTKSGDQILGEFTSMFKGF
jgi:hypothetical protein